MITILIYHSFSVFIKAKVLMIKQSLKIIKIKVRFSQKVNFKLNKLPMNKKTIIFKLSKVQV